MNGKSAQRSAVDFVVTHRHDAFSSGVARFNQLLAEALDVPVKSLFDERLPKTGNPLLSFKVTEFSDVERDNLHRILSETSWNSQVFLHDWGESPVEELLVRRAQHVFCGNHEIEDRVRVLNPSREVSWSPGLIRDTRLFEPCPVSIFSFGMAHKIQTRMYERLKMLLDSTGRGYRLYLSTADHETSSARDNEVVFEEMHRIFPDELYFLGRLSDVAIYNRLQTSTFFSAFFPRGVRANNGTVAAAMEHGAVVITNLDRYSPPEYKHGETVIDINQAVDLPATPFELRSLSVRATQTHELRSWSALVDRVRGATNFGEMSPHPDAVPSRVED